MYWETIGMIYLNAIVVTALMALATIIVVRWVTDYTWSTIQAQFRTDNVDIGNPHRANFIIAGQKGTFDAAWKITKWLSVVYFFGILTTMLAMEKGVL
jgi:hypothetical protein